MRANLRLSPFRSVWTFLVYCLTLSTPVWKLLSYLGNIDLFADYADTVVSFLDNPLGMWVQVVTGCLLLIRINHKERRADGEGDEGMTQVEQESPIERKSTTTDTEEPLPREFLTREPEETYFKEQPVYIAGLARKGVELKGKTFENCQIFGPAIIAPFYESWPF